MLASTKGTVNTVARTADALVEPSVLRWARKSLGLRVEDVARRMNLDHDRVAGWEAGEGAPTVAQLRNLASICKRPVAVFFLSEPPKTFDAMRDFRRLPDNADRRWSTALHTEFRRAHEQRDTVLELLKRSRDEVATFWRPTQDVYESPEEIGNEIRQLLKITQKEQRGWRSPYQALAGWISLLEEAGVLVIQTDRVELAETRGFSIYADQVPVVAINGKDDPRPKIFTLLHEYVHLIIRNAGLCDETEEYSPQSPNRKIEILCNHAAAAALMPRNVFEAIPAVRLAPDGNEAWTEKDISTIGAYFGVSREAAVRRLLTIGKTTLRFYQQKRAEYKEAYEAQVRIQGKKKTGTPPYPRTQVRNLGKGYVRQVLDAYYHERVSVSEASDFLRARANNIEKFAIEARTGGVGV